MGSIQVDSFAPQCSSQWCGEQFEVGGDFKRLFVGESLKLKPGWTSNSKHETLLLSWLLALARTRGVEDFSFQWDYGAAEAYVEHGKISQTLSAIDIISDTQVNVASAIQTIVTRIINSERRKNLDSNIPDSLILSVDIPSVFLEQPKQNVLMVEIRFNNEHLEARLPQVVESIMSYSVQQHLRSWSDMIWQCISHPESSLADCLRPSVHDLDEIWSWNHALPPTYSICMHDIIAQKAHESPQTEAIVSWDGNLTYQQVDEYSTLLACRLKAIDVQLNSVVPVCFEKSRWTVVAILGVMKAGATFVLLDPTIPLLRLQEMVHQVDAKIIVSSRRQHELAQSILSDIQILIVDAETMSESSITPISQVLPAVSPSSLMYIIFTSGSTGIPKGVMISHETYTSSAIPRAEAVGYGPSSRVLDFASYAFDVSIDSMLCTLSRGGCLCIPSDEDRLNDLNRVIREMRITYAGLTPSVARILDQDVVSSMECLGLGGEAVTARNVAHLGQLTRIVIGYGPCECTIGCTINSSAAYGRNYVSIGRGNGAVIWIVNPENPDMLSPVGAVGELWVEGPIVGQGYLNSPEKTAASFMEDPPWLIAGHNNYPGRRGRLYKTGDLVKYDPDGFGGFVFVGRKDTQVKLRGQRVELGEIEWQLKNVLPPDAAAIVEVIPATNNGRQAILAAFVAPSSESKIGDAQLELATTSASLTASMSDANVKLARVLPRYMLPTVYLPINYIPVLISGKTDRKALRSFGNRTDLKELENEGIKKQGKPLDDKEILLQKLWSKVINLELASIEPHDNFFALGGDSVAAMKLVSVARESGLDLTVAEAFLHPTLSKMAAVMRDRSNRSTLDISAFSLLSVDPNVACQEVAAACSIDMAEIDDIYPCTPTQQSLFTFSLKSAVPYVAQRLFRIPSHISTNVWKKSWEIAVASTPILRVRVHRSQAFGLQQVVVRKSIQWRQVSSLIRYLETDHHERMDLGQSLARYAIIEDPNEANRYMVWTIHHVLYDGWSESRVLERVWHALQNNVLEPKPQITTFIRYLQDQDEAEVLDFWRTELLGAVGPQFPKLPSRHFVPHPDTTLEHHVDIESAIDTTFTIATLIRGAWALVASQHTSSEDVVFCETFTGRDIPLEGVEEIEGPLIATSPVRIRIDRASTVESYLQGVQRSILKRAKYQHCGMQNIRKASKDAEYACEARTGIVIQTDTTYEGQDLGFQAQDPLLESLHFNPYPLMLACGVRSNGYRICANFDSSLIGTNQVERLFSQLQTVFEQLAADNTRRLATISCLSVQELDKIWQMNCTAPLSLEETSSDLRASTHVRQGSVYPPLAVAWVCSPQNPSHLSPIDCVGELWIEGAFSTNSKVECPDWLLAGSLSYPGRTGVVNPTGDLVKLHEDGTLIFIGRKQDILPVQGHSLDRRYLENQFRQHLPSNVRFETVLHGSGSGEQATIVDQKLVLLLEQPTHDTQHLQLLPAEYEVQLTDAEQCDLKLKVCADLSISLVENLKALNKFAEDTLQPFMVPFAYLVTDKIPQTNPQNKENPLQRLINSVPLDILHQARDNLHGAWIKRAQSVKLTAAEDALLLSWAKVLQINPDHIDIDDNFFRLGGDSVLAMKLVSNLRAQGHILTVADLFQHTRLADTARAMKLASSVPSRSEPSRYKNFSLLSTTDTGAFISSRIRPRLDNPEWSIQDVMPVTDSQALDIRATIDDPRTSVQYTMLTFNDTIDHQRLMISCDKLLKSHDILRTVFVEHESGFLQVVLKELDMPVLRKTTDQDLKSYIQTLCAEDIEISKRLGALFFQVTLVEGNLGECCLIITLSHAQYDGISLPILLRDLEILYTGGNTITYEPFSTYMAGIHDLNAQTEAIKYWSDLLHGSSLSILDTHPDQINERSIFVSRPVKVGHCPKDITTSNLLASAWSLTLARHLQESDLTFGIITSGRQIELANVENIVGPCYQFTPVRVPMDPTWTGHDLMTYVQKQTAASAAHDHLGFDMISSRCTNWSADVKFFNSVVNHQDWEDFDTMPFAGGTCKVDIANPHGDAAHPLKVVTFRRDGELHAGIVGSEKKADVVKDLLEKLVDALEHLAASHAEPLVIR